MANFIVTFSNEAYTSAGEEPTLHDVTVPVDFGVEVTADNLDDFMEQLDLYATTTWDEVDWTLDEPGWEIVAVELPNGDVVDL